MLELYENVLPDAPYVIGAYALLWVALVAYIGVTFRRVTRLEKELEVVEASIERRKAEQ
jgi:CcmD family protein